MGEQEDAEQEAKKAEIEKIKKDSAPAQKKKEADARKKHANPFSGNIHNADGSQTFVDNGHKVDGANHWAQKKTAADKWAEHVESEAKANEQKAKARAAKAGPDGLIHNDDGTEE